MRMLSSLIVSVSLLALQVAPAHAARKGTAKSGFAPPTDDAEAKEKARRHFRAGKAMHDLGRYEEAIAQFMDAYVLAPHPDMLLNIAQSYRLWGHAPEAIGFYRKYLAAAPDSPRRASVETLIRELEASMASRTSPTVDVPPPAVTVPVSDGAGVVVGAGTPEPKGRSVIKAWWLWTVVGVVAIGGATAGVLVAAGAGRLPHGGVDTIDFRDL